MRRHALRQAENRDRYRSTLFHNKRDLTHHKRGKMFPIFPLLLYPIALPSIRLLSFVISVFASILTKGVNAALSQGLSVLQQEIARDRNLLFADEIVRQFGEDGVSARTKSHAFPREQFFFIDVPPLLG